jgi:hypothetical protein
VKRIVAVAGMAIVMMVSLAGPASAEVLERDTFHDEFSQQVSNFCGVSGLTVRFDLTADGQFAVKTHGSDQLPYYQEHVDIEVVYTNVRTKQYVTDVFMRRTKDLRVTNNGDGTLTLLVLQTGNNVTYDGNGKIIARDPGQVRYENLIDHGGTPSDPSDDEFIEFLGIVKDFTGRTDDFCTAVVPAIS